MSSSPPIGSVTVHLQNPQRDLLERTNKRLRRALKKLENFSVQNSGELKQKHHEIAELIERIDKIRKKLVGLETTEDSKSLIKKVTTKLDRCDTLLRSVQMALVNTSYMHISPRSPTHEFFGVDEETQARKAPSDQDERVTTLTDLFTLRENYCSNTVNA